MAAWRKWEEDVARLGEEMRAANEASKYVIVQGSVRTPEATPITLVGSPWCLDVYCRCRCR